MPSTIEWGPSDSVSAGMGGFRSRVGVVQVMQVQTRLLEKVKVDETSVLEMLKERGWE